MMWGQSGGRSFIRGKGPLSQVLRLLIIVFLIAGVIAVVALVVRAGEARAKAPQENPTLRSLGADALENDNLPHAYDAGWRGAKVCEVIEESEEVRAARCAFPPGVGHEKHWHGAHFGYILAGGRMRITDDKGTTERDLKTGGSWWSDGVVHEAVNIGETTAVYVIVETKKAH
jgi:quercetin dioxygenase-like cupin family protein